MMKAVIHLDRSGAAAFIGWAGEVNTFAELPLATENVGSFYMVLNATGSRFLLNYKASGLYRSEGGSWIKKNNVGLYLNDDQFAVYNAVDNSKMISFDVSGITTGTRRTATWQDSDGEVAWLSDVSGSTLRNINSTDTFATANETINCTANTFTVNLPTAVGIQGTTYTLVNSGIGVITLDANGTETINGSLTIDIKKQYVSRTVQSDGTNWIII